MKIQFKHQAFQTDAVEAVGDCFAGQPRHSGVQYRIDPGREEAAPGPSPGISVATGSQQELFDDGQQTLSDQSADAGFRNHDIELSPEAVLDNIRRIQHTSNLPASTALVSTPVCGFNLDIEMETGTGKTYCYIKAMFEFYRRYGWGKFIIVVPSIAIREGVHKSLQITAEHFLADYGRRARFFIYNSKELHQLESFSSDAGINVMVINVQAFNARGKDQRRIYEELDDFQSRRPIDVIKANRPILILDEPQKMEGKKTLDSLREFKPLLVLRYSATHKTEHNKVYRLDALDAYNQKLVKKIAVRGISVRGLAGGHAYLYLESIEVSARQAPTARMEIELRRKTGIKRVLRKIGRNDNLFELSGGLEQYKDGFVVSDIDARSDTVSFVNGLELHAGEAVGDVNEATLRRIQIREAVRAHFAKEQALFHRGIKVLTLFFIDEVAKYRQYQDGVALPGEYAEAFEQEYRQQLNEVLTLEDTPYNRYLQGIDVARTHDGYFSIDKKTRQLVDPKTKARSNETDDVAAYDLILKDKERLLSFDEPVRFIFSHSALREGWDNPNVFVIGTLKHSDNTVSRRQEVGRGLRLAVNQHGERMDDPATVHDINLLTVVASESYQDFVTGLQRDISETLSARPREANEAFFVGKVLKGVDGDVLVDAKLAKQVYRYLLKNDYIDDEDHISQDYHGAKAEGQLAALPAALAGYQDAVFALVDSVFSDGALPTIADERRGKQNPLNANFDKREFKQLWQRINRKAAYTVHFDSDELIANCVAALDAELRVSPMQYVVTAGQQTESTSADALQRGEGFEVRETTTEKISGSARSAVKYDLVGHLATEVQLTRRTVVAILQGINAAVFAEYRRNPEDFLLKAVRLINEQKATAVVEHLAYNLVDESFELDIFTQAKPAQDFSSAIPVDRHIYDYVFTDSKNERRFVRELDVDTEVVVYAKLPGGFYIPTPVGPYNPDWAIAFRQGKVKHVFFIAETKGSMSSMDLRKIEAVKIDCARRFFSKIADDDVTYDVVDSYAKLMELVG